MAINGLRVPEADFWPVWLSTSGLPVIRVEIANAIMESASNDLPFRCQIEIAMY